MALRTLPDIGACKPLHESRGRLQGSEGRWDQVEHATAGKQGLGTAAIAEQPVMAQALKAPGGFCQLVEAETLMERTDSLSCPCLSLKQPTPCP